MFILHVKCNFDENFKDLLSYSNIFDERFFFGSPLRLARLRSFISSVILPSSLSYVPCTVLKFRALDRFPGINVPGIFYSRNFLNWVLTALFHPLANV